MVRGYKFNDKSYLVVGVKVKEEQVQGEDGKWKKRVIIKEQVAKGEINLGSAKNPNKDIVKVRYETEEDDLGDALGKLFGGKRR